MLNNLMMKFYRLFKKSEVEKSISEHHIHPSAIIYKRNNLVIHKTALICEYVIIRTPEAKVFIGENSQIGPFTVILSFSDILIGNNVMIAPHCVIAAGNHNHLDLSKPMRFSENISLGPIIIEDDVWISANCTITDNVTIGKGAIIGANTLVNKNVLPYEIVGGVPMKHISSRKK